MTFWSTEHVFLLFYRENGHCFILQLGVIKLQWLKYCLRTNSTLTLRTRYIWKVFNFVSLPFLSFLSQSGWRAFSVALVNAHPNVVETMLRFGASVNLRDSVSNNEVKSVPFLCPGRMKERKRFILQWIPVRSLNALTLWSYSLSILELIQMIQMM